MALKKGGLQLEEENRRLKKLLADTMLDKQILQDIVEKSSKAGVNIP